MKLDLLETIKFFDHEEESIGHAPAIIGVVGEEINSLMFKHYLESKNKDVDILDCPVTQGTVKGKRLDRWVLTKDRNEKDVLYQCEIKNWSATAVGGVSLSVDAQKNKIVDACNHNWERNLKGFSKDFDKSKIAKTLKPMKPPQEYDNNRIEPLLVYWMVISSPSDVGIEPFFSVPVSTFDLKFETPFEEINIFSVSLYLRQLVSEGREFLEISSEKVERRLEALNKMIIE